MHFIQKNFLNFNIYIYKTHEETLFRLLDILNVLNINQFEEFDQQDVYVIKDFQFITQKCVYKLIFIIKTPIAKEFEKWIYEVSKELYVNHQDLLLKTLNDKEQEILQYKEKVCQENDKSGYVYIIQTDAQNAYKVGKTKDVITKRIRSLQTGNMHNIKILFNFKTSNCDILEKLVHYILAKYRCNSNREFFECDINYIKNIIKICGNTIDILKSTNQYTRLIESNIVHEYQQNDFCEWLDKNIRIFDGGILRLKDICELYTGNLKTSPRISNKFKLETESFIKTKFHGIQSKYKDSTFNGERYKGWIGLTLI